MIVSCAPVRISLGGGGTDLKSYYSQFGGFLIAAAINKYVYICMNKRFENNIRLSYSQTETVDSVNQIQHKIFKEALKLTNVNTGVELVSIADVPANCGLGSSSSFSVSLLNALNTYKREFISLKDLAEQACKLEIDILKEPIGKQDQYIASFGGVTCFTFQKDGQVIVEPIKMAHEKLIELENNILIFYTRIQRKASDILAVQNQKTQENNQDIINRLHKIKDIGLQTKEAFQKADLNIFGELLDLHWQTKKKLSNKVSDPFLDECYDVAIKNGALGGKVMGAGGGGFFMFYVPGEKTKIISALSRLGLLYMPYQFDFEGAKISLNMKKGYYANICQPVFERSQANF